MKKTLTKNWQAKLASLLVAFALWYVIHESITENRDGKPPKARPVKPSEL